MKKLREVWEQFSLNFFKDECFLKRTECFFVDIDFLLILEFSLFAFSIICWGLIYYHSSIKKMFSLTHFSPMFRFIQKPVIWFEMQIKWLISLWNKTMGWNGLRNYILGTLILRIKEKYSFALQGQRSYI